MTKVFTYSDWDEPVKPKNLSQDQISCLLNYPDLEESKLWAGSSPPPPPHASPSRPVDLSSFLLRIAKKQFESSLLIANDLYEGMIDVFGC